MHGQQNFELQMIHKFVKWIWYFKEEKKEPTDGTGKDVYCVEPGHHLSALTVPSARVPAPHNRSQHIQANTNTRFYTVCSPDDGHNDARNMLRLN